MFHIWTDTELLNDLTQILWIITAETDLFKDEQCVLGYKHLTALTKQKEAVLFQPLYSKRYVSFSHLHPDHYN